jgi:hypothetical protein
VRPSLPPDQKSPPDAAEIVAIIGRSAATHSTRPSNNGKLRLFEVSSFNPFALRAIIAGTDAAFWRSAQSAAIDDRRRWLFRPVGGQTQQGPQILRQPGP